MTAEATYTSQGYADVARLMRVRLSVGRTGVCWENAVAEAFFVSLKNEMFYHGRFATRAGARLAVAEYIEVFYNRKEASLGIGIRYPGSGDARVLLRPDRNRLVSSRPGCLKK
ncbi:IS3 family transposase [Kocuria sp. KD4]|nr:IS3 family transposase [Kocuria sp. KD4]